MEKEVTSNAALQHYKDIMKNNRKEIAYSIKNTRIYGPSFPERETKEKEASVMMRLLDATSSHALTHLPQDKKICILNFANYMYPGGGFLEGDSAQEEMLCHESTLYPVLEAFDSTYYNWNNFHLCRNLYTDRALYSPDICFGDRKVDVMSCAAPNFSTNYASGAEYVEALTNRIKFIYTIAEKEKVDILILGAWGCGVFGNAPHWMVEILKEEKFYIPEIIFAIPNKDSFNYKAFKEILFFEFKNQDNSFVQFCPEEV